MRLILASNNKDKLREFKELFEGTDTEIVSQREAGYDLDVDETGLSFEENAWLKASAVTRLSGLAAVADDSGLEVRALGGEPGIYSARYGVGHDAPGEARNEYLLKKLGDAEDRAARYVCCICCTMPNGDTLTARGECEGTLLYAPRGAGGFGYDPLFVPQGMEKTMAELTDAEKNAISHRGKAAREFAKKLKEYRDGADK